MKFPVLRRLAATAAALATLSLPVATEEKSAPAAQKVTAARATIRTIRREVLDDVVRVTVELDAEVPFHDERIENPARVFVDLHATRAAPPLVDRTLRFDGDTAPVHQIRLGRHTDGTTRIVLEAADVSAYNVYQLYSPFRLVIDCARKAPVVETPPLVARRIAPLWERTPWVLSRGGGAQLREAMASTPHADAEPSLSEEPPPAPAVAAASHVTPPRPSNSFSVARQLGLGVSRIVIDPGLGGHDPGAQNGDVSEAAVVLDVALRLEKLLTKAGTDVVLTRREDEFVTLQERTGIANREEADLFLSIHTNANASAAVRGVETYILNFASNMSAAKVAARENAASGQSMGALPDFVKAIALNNKLDESREFAALVQQALIERLRPANKTVRDLGVKQAPFVVLIGAAMPSVLAEISFVTNSQEAKLLNSPAYRQRIAEALFNAIRKYQTSLKNVAAVAERKSQ